jgi:hypothetical protein
MQKIFSGSSFTAWYSGPFSQVISGIFMKVFDFFPKEESEKVFLFSNDSFVPHRIVNCVCAISNDVSP